MTYDVVHLPQAQADLNETLAWLHERSPSGAATWFERWLEVEDLLRRIPESQPRAPESSEHDEEIRNVIFKTRRGRKYRCLFLVRETTVYVLHIRGPGQNLVSRDRLQLPE